MMKLSRYWIYGAMLWISACKVPEIKSIDQQVKLPENFIQQTDTSNNLANISWRNYFKDPLLVQLIDTALVRNWDLQSMLQRIEQARADVLQTTQALKPTVDPLLAPSMRRFGLYTMDGAGNIVTDIEPGKLVPINLPDLYTGFQAKWEADIWGKLKNKKLAATQRLLASAEGRNLMITNLITEVANAYYQLIALDQEIKIIDETIAVQTKVLDIVKVQKEAAASTELAVKQFEAQLLNLNGFRLELQQIIVETENRINFLCGRTPTHVERAAQFPALPEKISAGIPAQLLQNRPDIRQAELELLASRTDLSVARKAFLPSLNITGNLGFQAFRPGLLFTTPESIAYSLVGGLTMPMINRAAIKAEFNNATARQMDKLYQYQQSVVRAYIEVYNEVARTNNLAAIVETKQKESVALNSAVDISADLFRYGRANYLEVLIAQQQALKARVELITARKNQLITTVNIYKSLGGGWR